MSASFAQYSEFFECALPRMQRYATLFKFVARAHKSVTLSLTFAVTLLNVLQGYDKTQSIVGLLAAISIALDALFPFREAGEQSTTAAKTMARYLLTRDDVPHKMLVTIANTECLWLTHPTSNSCAHGDRAPGARRNMTGDRRPAPMRTVAQSDTTTEFEMRCAVIGFDTIAKRFYAIYYVLVSTQIIVTLTAALLHSSWRDLGVPPHAIAVIGAGLGGWAAFVGSLVALLPIEAYAKECRMSYALTIEYYISGAQVPKVVLEQLKATQTLCFLNPMLAEQCLMPVAIDRADAMTKKTVVPVDDPYR